MHSQHIIETVTMEYLLPPRNTRTLLFYGIPNIHNPNCRLCPILNRCDNQISQNRSLLTDLSPYITHCIQPLANNLLSQIKNTKHFLNLIENLPLLLTNAFLVTVDVTSRVT